VSLPAVTVRHFRGAGAFSLAEAVKQRRVLSDIGVRDAEVEKVNLTLCQGRED
jgi:hypothetical protein